MTKRSPRMGIRVLPDCDELSAFEQSMDEWVALFASRDEMAVEYGSCLRQFTADWDRWPDFNAAILRRWSPAGLEYIKRKAWS